MSGSSCRRSDDKPEGWIGKGSARIREVEEFRYPCASGRHAWPEVDDAARCCNPYFRRDLVRKKETNADGEQITVVKMGWVRVRSKARKASAK